MNDTETRLRDYLHTQAATVPDDAHGPGLDEPRHRRHWPVLMAAAAIAAVLVLTATFLTRLSEDMPEPAGPVSTAPPTIPYTAGAMMHDGDQRVRIPKGVDGFFFGRVDGGWLGGYMPKPGQFQAAVLNANGAFRTIGPQRSGGTTLSPDRKQVAVMHYRSATEGDIVIVDLASGRAVSTTQLPYQPILLGWNQSGLWMSNDGVTTSELMVWRQPGSGQPEHVDFAGFQGGGMSAPAGTDTIALYSKNGDDRCVKAAVLRDDALKILRQYCDAGPEALYPLMSPDGRKMVNSLQKLVVDVRSGKVTKLQLPAAEEMTDFPSAQFEDANQLILLTTPPPSTRKLTPQTMYRCDVRSGECAVLQKNGAGITLQQP